MNITTMLENPVELTREIVTENPTLQARLADLKKRDEEYTKISSSLPLNIDYTRLDHTQLKAVVYTRCKYFLSHILYDPITNAPVLAYDVMCKILYDSKAGMTANDPVFMSDTLSNMFIKNMLKSRKSGNIPNSILTTDFKLNDVAHSLNSWFGAKSLAKCFNFINNNICKKNNLSFKTNKFTIC